MAARVREPHLTDDIVQETLLRMVQARRRLEVETLSAYAFTVARNLVYEHAREVQTARRHQPQLLELRSPDLPENAAVTAESRTALAAALTQLTPTQLGLLVQHDLHERSLADLSARRAVAPGVLASQLTRTRAKLRVDYLLALRRLTLPTAQCRPVLMALSAGDRRRQQALQAGDHLAGCPTCAEVAPALLRRERALAGLLPWVPLGAMHGRVEGWVRGHAAASAGAAAAGVAGLVTAVVLSAGNSPAPASGSTPTPAPTRITPTVVSAAPSAVAAVPDLRTASNARVFAERSRLAALVGTTVRADGATVLSVPADEGFWLGRADARVWVQLAGSRESRLTIKPGMRLRFEARVVANTEEFLRAVGVGRAEGRAALAAAGYHLLVAPGAITVR
ncbi:MAG TPA: sigma-70 family RNA polymerase sigma factor [Dermatophilaceae bacterium]|nr:sigma-70 family RNA polymerase sigma factor [Dermatophilaceae bacterium]